MGVLTKVYEDGDRIGGRFLKNKVVKIHFNGTLIFVTNSVFMLLTYL